jgi:hypothetical protein
VGRLLRGLPEITEGSGFGVKPQGSELDAYLRTLHSGALFNYLNLGFTDRLNPEVEFESDSDRNAGKDFQ